MSVAIDEFLLMAMYYGWSAYAINEKRRKARDCCSSGSDHMTCALSALTGLLTGLGLLPR
jgi:hypothetical protein